MSVTLSFLIEETLRRFLIEETLRRLIKQGEPCQEGPRETNIYPASVKKIDGTILRCGLSYLDLVASEQGSFWWDLFPRSNIGGDMIKTHDYAADLWFQGFSWNEALKQTSTEFLTQYGCELPVELLV